MCWHEWQFVSLASFSGTLIGCSTAQRTCQEITIITMIVLQCLAFLKMNIPAFATTFVVVHLVLFLVRGASILDWFSVEDCVLLLLRTDPEGRRDRVSTQVGDIMT